jgi:hypothetical protein
LKAAFLIIVLEKSRPAQPAQAVGILRVDWRPLARLAKTWILDFSAPVV